MISMLHLLAAAAMLAAPVSHGRSTSALATVDRDDAAATTLVLDIRCRDQPASWGEVRVEGPRDEVVIAPIGKDGRACIPGFAEGWACVREVRAGTGERGKAEREHATWCLDAPLHLSGAAEPVTLNLSRAFDIWQFGPKSYDASAVGTATLIRTSGAHGSYVVDQCELEGFLAHTRFLGVRPGDYRVVLPWRNRSYISTATARLDGPSGVAEDLSFELTVVSPKDKGKLPAPEGDWLGSSGRTLSGTLLGEDGAPLPGGVLTLVRSDLPGPRVVESRRTAALGDTVEALCDGDGNYQVRGLLEGMYLVSARAHVARGAGRTDASPAMLFESVRFGEGTQQAGSGEPLESTPVPAPVAMLKGWVDGEIPDGLRVLATPESYLGELEAEVHGDGSYSFGEVPLDDYWIDVLRGDRAPGLCLAAPRAATAGGEPIELVPRTSTRLSVVASFPAARYSYGLLQVAEMSAEEGADRARRAARSLPPPQDVKWNAIGTTVIDGLPPGRFRVTFSETRGSAGGQPPRFALGWIEIPQDPPAAAAIQLEVGTGRSFRLFNDDPRHPIQVDVENSEGLLYRIEIPAASDQTVVLPGSAGSADPLRAVVRQGLGLKPRVVPIPQDEVFLRISANER